MMTYFANSTEGAVLDAQCENCPLGEIECPAYMTHAIYNYEAANNATARGILNTLVHSNGECLMRNALKQENVETRSAMINKLKEYNEFWKKV